MRGLVWIDAGVLNQGMLYRVLRGFGGIIARGQQLHCCGTVQPCVDVACAGNLKAGEARQQLGPGFKCRDKLFGDFARGLAQLPGQAQGNRQRILPEANFGRLLD
jgi:hypothetical protein